MTGVGCGIRPAVRQKRRLVRIRLTPPSNAAFGRFAYTGQIELTGLGLYYYKARIYDPALGRFLQTDPIGYEDQMCPSPGKLRLQAA